MARHSESARRAPGSRSVRAGSRFRGPSKRIGDVLVALSPEEVRGICDGSSRDITAKEVRARLVAGLERLSANRLREVASTLDVPIEGVHEPIVALLEEDDGAGARWREGQGWSRNEVGRDALLAGLGF